MLTWLALAEPANFELVPGQRMGPVSLGGTIGDCKMGLKGWSYSVHDEYIIGPYYHYPREKEGTLVQFVIGFTPKGRVRDFQINDPSMKLKGSPKVHLGCSKEDVLEALGPPSKDFRNQLDYPELGIRFNFEDGRPARAADPYPVQKFEKGQCEWIQIYRPNSE